MITTRSGDHVSGAQDRRDSESNRDRKHIAERTALWKKCKQTAGCGDDEARKTIAGAQLLLAGGLVAGAVFGSAVVNVVLGGIGTGEGAGLMGFLGGGAKAEEVVVAAEKAVVASEAVTATAVASVETAGTSAAKALPQVRVNAAAAKAQESLVAAEVEGQGYLVAREVTVVTDSGVRTRLDILASKEGGAIRCLECKSSATAPLTANQAAAFPEIATSGATVVGKGKPGFPGGFRIPPTVVEIFRPKP